MPAHKGCGRVHHRPPPPQGGGRAQGLVRRLRARPLLRHDHLGHHRRLRWHLGEEGLGACVYFFYKVGVRPRRRVPSWAPGGSVVFVCASYVCVSKTSPARRERVNRGASSRARSEASQPACTEPRPRRARRTRAGRAPRRSGCPADRPVIEPWVFAVAPLHPRPVCGYPHRPPTRSPSFLLPQLPLCRPLMRFLLVLVCVEALRLSPVLRTPRSAALSGSTRVAARPHPTKSRARAAVSYTHLRAHET